METLMNEVLQKSEEGVWRGGADSVGTPTLRRCINYGIFVPSSRISNQEWRRPPSLRVGSGKPLGIPNTLSRRPCG